MRGTADRDRRRWRSPSSARRCGGVERRCADGARARAGRSRPASCSRDVSNWAVELNRARSAGARLGRLTVSWPAVAPERPLTRHSRARSRDGRSTAGRQPTASSACWPREASSPCCRSSGAPRWAQRSGPRPNGGAFRPSPQHLADFAHAAALRYSGSFEDLPRVRYWQVWNEPNLTHFLNPQYERGRLVSPGWYRGMVNAFAGAVKAVHDDNVVVAGGLAPFECHGRGNQRACGSAPLAFMRSFFCLSRTLRPTCSARARIDAWSTHPYTAGGPDARGVPARRRLARRPAGDEARARRRAGGWDASRRRDRRSSGSPSSAGTPSLPTAAACPPRCTRAGRRRRCTACGRPASAA